MKDETELVTVLIPLVLSCRLAMSWLYVSNLNPGMSSSPLICSYLYLKVQVIMPSLHTLRPRNSKIFLLLTLAYCLISLGISLFFLYLWIWEPFIKLCSKYSNLSNSSNPWWNQDWYYNESNYICTCMYVWLSSKESACQHRRQEDTGWSSGLGRIPGGGNSNPLQYFCLENPMDRRPWQAIVTGSWRVREDCMTEHTHTPHTHTHTKNLVERCLLI